MTSLSLGPHYRGRLGTVLHFAHCVYSQSSSVASLVSATYPSTKQVLSRESRVMSGESSVTPTSTIPNS